MKIWAVLVLLMTGCAATFAGGWFGAALPDDAPVGLSGALAARPIGVIAEDQNRPFKTSADALRALGLGKPDMAETAAPSPPEADPRDGLRRAVSAVVKDGKSYVLIVVDAKEATGWGRRKAGDAFGNGWKFFSISPVEVVLRRGSEEIRLPVMSAMAAPDAAPQAAPTPAN